MVNTSGAEEPGMTRLSSLLNVRLLAGTLGPRPSLMLPGEAITHLLENGFEPRRTIILSHGFDEEEVFARRGQGKMAPFLEKRYGRDGLLMVIDEGAGWTDDVRRSVGTTLKLVLRRTVRFARDGREGIYGHQSEPTIPEVLADR